MIYAFNDLENCTGFVNLSLLAIHILSNISRSKSNQTMIFGQLIKYNKRNNFLKKSWRKRGKETSSRSLLVF